MRDPGRDLTVTIHCIRGGSIQTFWTFGPGNLDFWTSGIWTFGLLELGLRPGRLNFKNLIPIKRIFIGLGLLDLWSPGIWTFGLLEFGPRPGRLRNCFYWTWTLDLKIWTWSKFLSRYNLYLGTKGLDPTPSAHIKSFELFPAFAWEFCDMNPRNH